MSEKSSTFVVLKGWGKTQKYSLRHILFINVFLYEYGERFVVAPLVVVVAIV